MGRSILITLILFGMMLSFFLAATEGPASAQALLGETPTVQPGTPTPTPTPRPIPVGGELSQVDRGAVLRATFGPWVVALAALIVLVGFISFDLIRRRSTD